MGGGATVGCCTPAAARIASAIAVAAAGSKRVEITAGGVDVADEWLEIGVTAAADGAPYAAAGTASAKPSASCCWNC